MNEKTAIVTGGSRGIGLATAKRLGLDGYNVVIFATRPKKDCEEQLKELEHLGICLHYVQGTLDHGEDRKRLIEETVKQFGRIDVLVNNAGVAPLVRADLLTMTEESYDRVMGINAKGTMFLTQLAANEMLKQEVIGKKRGTIVDVGSCSAEVSSVNRGGILYLQERLVYDYHLVCGPAASVRRGGRGAGDGEYKCRDLQEHRLRQADLLQTVSGRRTWG